jgi:hypothetical protein
VPQEYLANSVEIAALGVGWSAAQPADGLSEQEIAEREAVIAAGLYRLRLAFPMQARSFTDEEAAATNKLWRDIFIALHPRVFHEAVMRFIVTDRKGFFPSPGQVVGIVEDMVTAYLDRQREIEEHQDDLANLRKTLDKIIATGQANGQDEPE